MTFADRIADARRAQHMTQTKLAELLSVSPEAVSKWERGEYAPTPEKLALLYKELKLPYLEDTDAEPLYSEAHMSAFIKGRTSGRGFPETQKALAYAKQAHEGQFRMPGDTPYINHPLTIVCHLHDVVEDCPVRTDELPVSEEVQRIVALVTKTGREEQAYYADIAGDLRACLVKCIDRCYNLGTMALGFSKEKIAQYVTETETNYPPLLKTLKAAPQYNDASWLLDYQIRALLRTAKRISSLA